MTRKVKAILCTIVAVALLVAVAATTVLAQDDPAPPDDRPGPLVKVAELLGIPPDDLTDALGQARQQLVEEVFTRTLGAIRERGIISDEEAATIVGWWAMRPAGEDEAAMKAWLEQPPELSKPEAIHHLLRTVFSFGGRGEDLIGQPRVFAALTARTAEILGVPHEDLVRAFHQVVRQTQQAALSGALSRAIEQGRITPEQAERIRQQKGQPRRALVRRQAPAPTAESISQMLARAIEAGRITQAEAGEISAWWQQRPEALDRLMEGRGDSPVAGE